MCVCVGAGLMFVVGCVWVGWGGAGLPVGFSYGVFRGAPGGSGLGLGWSEVEGVERGRGDRPAGRVRFVGFKFFLIVGVSSRCVWGGHDKNIDLPQLIMAKMIQGSGGQGLAKGAVRRGWPRGKLGGAGQGGS